MTFAIIRFRLPKYQNYFPQDYGCSWHHWTALQCLNIDVKRHNGLQRQKLLLSGSIIPIDFANHLKSRGVQSIFVKTFWWHSTFNRKSENINSKYFRMIFTLSANVCMQRSCIIFQQYFKKPCENLILFGRYGNYSRDFKGSTK